MKTSTIFFIIGLAVLVYFIVIIVTNHKVNYREDGPIIYIKQDQVDNLNTLYKISKTERVFCLGGIINDKNITIDKIDEIILSADSEQTKRSITIKSGSECPNVNDEKLLGVLHFHPNSLSLLRVPCKFSDRDLFTFGAYQNHFLSDPLTPNYQLNGIQCGINKFVIIDSLDSEGFQKSLKYNIIK